MREFTTGLVVTCAVFFSGCTGTANKPTGTKAMLPQQEGMSYLDNGKIRLGVDLNLGGAITYLADSKERVNMVNNHDWGRQIQMSFYSGPKPYKPNGKEPYPAWAGCGWNPIQSGDVFDNRSKVLEYKNDGQRLYVKCVPMQWPLNNEPGDCTFESWIELKDNAAFVRNRLNNNRTDRKQYPGMGQELPAVYTNGRWWKRMTYAGDKPFTGDKLTQMQKRWGPDTDYPTTTLIDSWVAAENWAALVDSNNWGMGVWGPHLYSFSCMFYGPPGTGGTKDNQCGYIGPSRQEILDYNIQYEFSYILILGKLDEIRQYVYDHAQRNIPPDYRFGKDRQHWFYKDAVDTGWPIKGQLYIIVDGNKPRLLGPVGFWEAKDAPRMYITAAYNNTSVTEARLFWKNLGDADFAEEKNIAFSIKPDGKFHTYMLNLSVCPNYKGVITGLRFDPVQSVKKGQHIKIKSISYRR